MQHDMVQNGFGVTVDYPNNNCWEGKRSWSVATNKGLDNYTVNDEKCVTHFVTDVNMNAVYLCEPQSSKV